MTTWQKIDPGVLGDRREYASKDSRWMIANIHTRYGFGLNWKLYRFGDDSWHFIMSYRTLKDAKAGTEYWDKMATLVPYGGQD
jgi:hypothetical protein